MINNYMPQMRGYVENASILGNYAVQISSYDQSERGEYTLTMMRGAYTSEGDSEGSSCSGGCY